MVTCAVALLTAQELTESSFPRLVRKLLLTKQYMKKFRELVRKEGQLRRLSFKIRGG